MRSRTGYRGVGGGESRGRDVHLLQKLVIYPT